MISRRSRNLRHSYVLCILNEIEQGPGPAPGVIMYYLVYGLLYLLSLLPMQVLYLFSNLLYGLIYYVAGYRKGVVMQNLAIAFPERPEQERIRMAKGVYRNFADFFVETIKLFSASKAFINHRFTGDTSVLDRLHDEGRKCQVHMGHNFNWEVGYQWLVMHIRQKPLGVYMPLANPVMEKVFRKLRSRNGGYLLPATDFKKALMPFRNDPYALLLAADQSSSGGDNGIWVPFFGKPTAFVRGPENGARLSNLAVVFCYIERVGRGYFKVHFHLEEQDPASLPKGDLTRRYALFLEEKMKAQPTNWLWTHRRWKHEWKPEFRENSYL